MTTLTYAGLVITLPDGLLWPNEFSWSPVDQSVNYTITGAMIVQSSKKLAGQPIVLAGDVAHTWMLRLYVKTLKQWAEEPGRVMTLNLRGVDRNVIFDHANTPIETADVWDFSDPDDTDFVAITLRFLTV
jgi:hypothetical protein